jgi:hypothetical protein
MDQIAHVIAVVWLAHDEARVLKIFHPADDRAERRIGQFRKRRDAFVSSRRLGIKDKQNIPGGLAENGRRKELAS